MFVPVMMPPPAQPSPRARELGEQIALFVKDYKVQNPDTSAMEIGQAMMLARGHLRKELGGGLQVKMVITGLAMGLVMLVGIGVFVMAQRGGGGVPNISGVPGPMFMIFAVGGLALLVGLVMLVARAKIGVS